MREVSQIGLGDRLVNHRLADFERSADGDAGVSNELVEVARDRFVDDDFLVVSRGMHEAHFTDLVLQRETDMGAKAAVVFCHDIGGVVEP
ncbi:MAG: hypothetical protein NWQ95_06925 [Verrucomicrobiales bacterium]|jgi:hypothetical protein|nr:hypothetical protein [Verrucomicrobiales bacterium]MDP4792040.1 hypothetical protein [Verrucomicrobiales bacterium]MDP4850066.1 hypothetical protein [Verrucomicrobiales bacterium]MDP5004398.1 hypothetical protein [Verrucomicrobiales bacterium]